MDELMDLSLIYKGMFIGLAIGVPVGPIGVLCIQRTLAKGRQYGLLSGLGVATADALYGFLAGFGLYFVQNLLKDYQPWIRPLACVIICALGVKIFFARPICRTQPCNGVGLLSAYSSSLLLTLTNPFTIIAFATAILTQNLTEVSGSLFHTGLLVAGIFCGSALWWVVISSGIGLFHGRFAEHELRLINRIAGAIVMLFGMVILLQPYLHYL